MYKAFAEGKTLEDLAHAIGKIHGELVDKVLSKNSEYNRERGYVTDDGLKSTENVVDSFLKAEEEEAERHNQIIDSDFGNTVESPVPEVDPRIIKDGEAMPELDSNGIPWDKRIHSDSKGKVKNGTWRTRRNIEVALLLSVEEELKLKVERLKTPIEIPAAPIDETTPVIETPVLTEALVDLAVPTTPTLVPAPLPVQETVGGHTFDTFKTHFPMVLGGLITEGKVSQEYVNQLKEFFKVDEIWNINDVQKFEMFNSFVESGIISKVG